MKSPPGPARLKFCATWAHNSTIYNTLQLTIGSGAAAAAAADQVGAAAAGQRGGSWPVTLAATRTPSMLAKTNSHMMCGRCNQSSAPTPAYAAAVAAGTMKAA